MKTVQITTIGAITLFAGCSSATTSERYNFAPDAGPLAYESVEHNRVSIDTPMGAQGAVDSSRSTIEVDIQDGRRVTARFLALEAWNSELGRRTGEGMLGEPFTGSVGSGGVIDVVARPDIPQALARITDPAALLADFLPPLPAGDAAEWPVEREYTMETGISATYRFSGTARFDGDTTWSGRPGRIIHVEGTFDTAGEGEPPGAPGKVELTVTGTTWTRYVWDAARGVMLAAVSRSDGNGTLSIPSMGMAFPATVTGSRTIDLKP